MLSGNDYGRNNFHATIEGDDLVIRVNRSRIIAKAGEPKPKNPNEQYKVNMVSTSGGFANVGGLKVSLNVTS